MYVLPSRHDRTIWIDPMGRLIGRSVTRYNAIYLGSSWQYSSPTRSDVIARSAATKQSRSGAGKIENRCTLRRRRKKDAGNFPEGAMQIDRIDHLNITVADLDRSL